MRIIPAATQDEVDIKTLLHICGLPSDDLSVSHLVHFFVIKETGQILGCVGLEVCGKFGLLRSLALAKPLRGRGLGIQLVEQIEAYAGSQQIHSLYLLTTTADRFFGDIGYQAIPRESAPAPVQETAEFQSICPASAVCMLKVLQ
ncbi:arsenic resistance N-acetyltransferase ArsN2 [Chloroflexota bacterium]